MLRVETLRAFEITEAAAGTVRFRVRVKPGAKRNSVGGLHDASLKVAVTQAPENGKANLAVVKLIAKRLGVAKSNISIVAGQTSRLKSIEAKKGGELVPFEAQTAGTV